MKDGFMLAVLENYGHPLKNKNATLTEQRRAYARILAERELHSYNRALPAQKRAEMSLQRLSGLVDHAYRTSEIYRELYQKAGFSPGSIRTYSDFCSLPWIDKELLLRISAEMTEREDIDRSHRCFTSGSTGRPLTLYNDHDRQIGWYASRFVMFEQMLERPLRDGERILIYSFESYMFDNILGRWPTYAIDLKTPPDVAANLIRDLRPTVVSGYSSRLIELSKYLPDAAEIGVELFSTRSESSTKQEREAASRAMGGVRVLDKYASEECGLIAFEEPTGGYRLLTHSCFLEADVEDLPFGNVLLTDFHSFSMPRIRYSQGDFVVGIDKLDAGLASSFSRIEGRQDMMLLSPKGQRIPPSVILGTIENHVLTGGCYVKEFRIIQDAPADVKIMYTPLDAEEDRASEVINKCAADIRSVMGKECNVTPVGVLKIPILGRKRRGIVRNFALSS